MRITKIIKRAWKNIWRERSRLLMSFLCMLMALLMLGAARLFFESGSWGLRECETILSHGIDGTGTIAFEGLDYKKVGVFLETAIDSGMVDAIGSFTSGNLGTEFLPQLREIQQTFPNIQKSTRYLWTCGTTRWSLGLCRELAFREKAQVPEEKWNNPNWCGIYLGASFPNIPLGTVYRQAAGGDTFYEYEVIGLLKPNQRVIGSNVFFAGKDGGYASSRLLDDLVVCVGGSKQAFYVNGLAFTPAEGVSLEETESYLRELAKEMEIPVTIRVLKEGFQQARDENARFVKIIRKLGFVMVGCCFLINVGTLILQFQARRRDFGILYACGCSKRDICGIFLAENGMKMLAAFFPAAFGLFLGADAYFQSSQSTAWVLGYVMKTDILPYLFFVALLFAVLFAAVPIIMLSSAEPVELCRDTRG